MWLIDKCYSICVELSTSYAVDLVFHSIIESEFYKSGYSVSVNGLLTQLRIE